MKSKNVRSQLRAFAESIAAVKANADLSNIGKDKQIQALRDTRQKYQAQALAELAEDAAAVRLAYARLEVRKKAAEAEAAGAWDYARLQYLAETVKAAVRQSSAGLLLGQKATDRIQVMYDTARASGDKHLARAWAEAGGGALAEVFPNDRDANHIALKMRRDLDTLLKTPALMQLEAESSQVAAEALDLQGAIAECDKAYYPEHSLFQTQSKFGALISDWHIEQHLDAETLGQTTSITIG